MLICLGFLYFIIFTWWESACLVSADSSSHLVVLVHGWLGNSYDLWNMESSFIEASNDIVVLRSSSNSFLRSLDGIDEGSKRLADEINGFKVKFSNLRSISFVGHSMGGMYARHVISLLYDAKLKTIAGLKPSSFVTLASPHASVRSRVLSKNHFSYYFFDIFKSLAGKSLEQLLLLDSVCSEPKICTMPLLAQMATHDDFINPLLSFPNRRLYGNLVNDLHVSLPTSLMLPHFSPLLTPLKNSTMDRSLATASIVSSFYSKGHASKHTSLSFNYSDAFNLTLNRNIENFLASNLNNIGWDRVVVDFPQAWYNTIPLAHNKIAWIFRDPITNWITTEGKFVVDDLISSVLHQVSSHRPQSQGNSERDDL